MKNQCLLVYRSPFVFITPHLGDIQQFDPSTSKETYIKSGISNRVVLEGETAI